ncbi:C40 family peptidase [Nocardiopsis gilva]|uniref:C40 family peptidase n=1 Tax=Nocardiopsis gilva TaxID=280236 RepID=UPI000349E87E|nr:C40 family peptidase [Nocardiopsis gilva]
MTLSVFLAISTTGLISATRAVADEHGGVSEWASYTAERAVTYATAQVGTPYKFGGSGPSGFDCSGLVQWAYKKAGKAISRTTYTQYREGSAVPRSRLRRGDLLFFYSGPSHVGMYVGNGHMIHAPRSGRLVQIVDMARYYDRKLVGARRVA